MTEPTVTLENLREFLRRQREEISSHYGNRDERSIAMANVSNYMALVRAAAKVVEASEVRKMGGHSHYCDIRSATPMRDVHCACGQSELKFALGAFYKISKGSTDE